MNQIGPFYKKIFLMALKKVSSLVMTILRKLNFQIWLTLLTIIMWAQLILKPCKYANIISFIDYLVLSSATIIYFVLQDKLDIDVDDVWYRLPVLTS